jgi:hypothetical protein
MKKSSKPQQPTPGTTEQTLKNLREVLLLLVKENQRQEIIINYLEEKLERPNSIRSD